LAISEPKPPPIRRDLEIVPQYYGGQLCYVAKDPVTLNYYRLGEVEYVVLKCFQDGMGVEQTIREVKKRTGFEIQPLEVYKFANQLRSSNLLKSKGMEDVRRLARNREKVRKGKLRQVLSNYLFLTIPIWDPDRVLNKLVPYFRWIMSRAFFFSWLALTAVALYIIVDNFSVLVADAFSLLSGWNLLILSIVIFSIKFIHEMGHALTCKYYGGEVHAIGPAFLVFQPCMFTDASDSWLFPSKWDRIQVTAAGIISEMMLASIASIVWISSDPGLLKQLAYTTMVTCSVSTILFNANPLLRFDGYYVLTDLVEIPNLRMKAEKHLGGLFDRYVLGIETEESPTSEHERFVYVTYGSARFLYRMIIVVSIGLFLYSIFPPLGVFMWATSLYGMILGPVWKRGKRLAQQYRSGRVRTRYLLIMAGLLLAAVSLWFIPINYTIQAPCVVAPPRLEVARTSVPGQIQSILVKPGDRVTAGQPLVQMVNPDLTFRARMLRARIAEMDARMARALVADPAAYENRKRDKKTYAEQLRKLEDDIARLTVRAPSDGVVVNVHRLEMKATQAEHQFVPFPDADPEADVCRLQGMTVLPGTGLLGVASTEGFRLDTFVYEHDVSLLRVGHPMVGVLRAHPFDEFETSVGLMNPVDVKEIENVGITLADVGYIPVKPSETGQQKPLVTLYMVRSQRIEHDEQLPWGLTGKARVTYGRGPVGRFYFSRIVRGLRLRMQAVTK